MTESATRSRVENAARTAEKRRKNRDENLRNGLLHALAARCREIAMDPAALFDAHGLASSRELVAEMLAAAPMSPVQWQRIARMRAASISSLQRDLWVAAGRIYSDGRMPSWITYGDLGERRSQRFERAPGGPPDALSLREVLEALALNETAADEHERASATFASRSIEEQSFLLGRRAHDALPRAATLIAHAARSFVRDLGSVEDMKSLQGRTLDHLEHMRVYQRWLRQLADRGAQPGDLRVAAAIHRVDGMVAGASADIRLPERSSPGSHWYDAPLYRGNGDWDQGVIDVLIARQKFELCATFVESVPDTAHSMLGRRDYALERLAVFLLQYPSATRAAQSARQAVDKMLPDVDPVPSDDDLSALSGLERRRLTVQYYLRRDWRSVRAIAIAPLPELKRLDMADEYSWHLQAALTRQAAMNIRGDEYQAGEVERHLGGYLRSEIEAGAAPFMDAPIREVAAEADPLPLAVDLPSAVSELLPQRAAQALSDAVWKYAIDRLYNSTAAVNEETAGDTLSRDALVEAANNLADVARSLSDVAREVFRFAGSSTSLHLLREPSDNYEI
ncbi:hypothetical protein [Demequina maris]|uniref:hypothetical protein n=1 Tax=Demequina maris TaxID=1638982 RepID=UPI0007848807|nr:hypothetical protein [Demequina maris]